MKETEFENLELARKAVTVAGEALIGLKERTVDSENGRDIKLAADKISEEIIIGQFLSATPYDILSEEKGLIKRGKDGYLWILDPLDGSANFSRKMDDLCCISLALWKDNRPILGVVNRFNTEELYSGIIGYGAWKNNNPIKTSNISNTGQAILATGFPVFRDYSSSGLSCFINNIKRFKKIRMLGSAALMGVYVAEGKIDAYIEEGIMLWDIAASLPIAIAAGAVADEISFPKDTDFRVLCQIFANSSLENDYKSYD